MNPNRPSFDVPLAFGHLRLKLSLELTPDFLKISCAQFRDLAPKGQSRHLQAPAPPISKHPSGHSKRQAVRAEDRVSVM